MKIAILVMDMRENFRCYTETTPRFPGGSASLFDGFARLPEVELHLLSCIQRPMQSPEKLADNIWYHGLLVPKIGWLRTGYQGCIRAVRRKLRQLQQDFAPGMERNGSAPSVPHFPVFPMWWPCKGSCPSRRA